VDHDGAAVLADKGWVYSAADEAWHLLNRSGCVVRRITAGFLAGYGAAQVNNYGVRHGWPELVPGAPYTVCVLDGGPMDGRHGFIAPGDGRGLPELVTVDHDGAVLTYRRTGQVTRRAHRFVLTA